MSDKTIDLLVLRRIAGFRRGDIVSAGVDDEKWANHAAAGNVKALDDSVFDEIAEDGGEFTENVNTVEGEASQVFDYEDDEALD